jgi:hypothetical protein
MPASFPSQHPESENQPFGNPYRFNHARKDSNMDFAVLLYGVEVDFVGDETRNAIE